MVDRFISNVQLVGFMTLTINQEDNPEGVPFFRMGHNSMGDKLFL